MEGNVGVDGVAQEGAAAAGRPAVPQIADRMNDAQRVDVKPAAADQFGESKLLLVEVGLVILEEPLAGLVTVLVHE